MGKPKTEGNQMSNEEVTEPINRFVSIVATYRNPTMRVTYAYHWYDAEQVTITPKGEQYQLTLKTANGDIAVMTEKFEARYLGEEEGNVTVRMRADHSDNIANDWLSVHVNVTPNGDMAMESVSMLSDSMLLNMYSNGFLLMDREKGFDVSYPTLIEGQ